MAICMGGMMGIFPLCFHTVGHGDYAVHGGPLHRVIGIADIAGLGLWRVKLRSVQHLHTIRSTFYHDFTNQMLAMLDTASHRQINVDLDAPG